MIECVRNMLMEKWGLKYGNIFVFKPALGNYFSDLTFKFTETNVMCKLPEETTWEVCNTIMLGEMITKEYSVEKIKWKPAQGESYFYLANNWDILKADWGENILMDLLRFNADVVFQCLEDACYHRAKLYKELTGKEFINRTCGASF